MNRASGIGQRGMGRRSQGGPRVRKATRASDASPRVPASLDHDGPVLASGAVASSDTPPPRKPHKRLAGDSNPGVHGPLQSEDRRPRLATPSDGEQPVHLYAIGIGSNRPLSGVLGPRAIVRAALVALDLPPLSLLARAPAIETAPIGPSLRRYANSAALVASHLAPLAMLDRLQALERQFGRRRFRRWGDRTLDLDMLLWSGGCVANRRLTVPHPLLRKRAFALAPLARIAPRWRDPVTGLTVAQLAARLARPRSVSPKGRLTARRRLTR